MDTELYPYKVVIENDRLWIDPATFAICITPVIAKYLDQNFQQDEWIWSGHYFYSAGQPLHFRFKTIDAALQFKLGLP